MNKSSLSPLILFIINSLLHPQKHESPKYKKLIKEGKIMPMPSFDWLDKKDLNDLVNFLQNLKATSKKQATLKTLQ